MRWPALSAATAAFAAAAIRTENSSTAGLMPGELVVLMDNVRGAGQSVQAHPRVAGATCAQEGRRRMVHLVAAEGAECALHHDTVRDAAGQHAPLRPGLEP